MQANLGPLSQAGIGANNANSPKSVAAIKVKMQALSWDSGAVSRTSNKDSSYGVKVAFKGQEDTHAGPQLAVDLGFASNTFNTDDYHPDGNQHGKPAMHLGSSHPQNLLNKGTAAMGSFSTSQGLGSVAAASSIPAQTATAAHNSGMVTEGIMQTVSDQTADVTKRSFAPRAFVEYVWLGGLGPMDVRSRTRIVDASFMKECEAESRPISADSVPVWCFDGSQTGQAPKEQSGIILVPRVVFIDPLRVSDSRESESVGALLVICDCYSGDRQEPLPSNSRAFAASVSERLDIQPEFRVDQMFTLFKDGMPVGFRSAAGAIPVPSLSGPVMANTFAQHGQGNMWYCSQGHGRAFGRRLVEAHIRACLKAGIKVSGVNTAGLPGQWSLGIGPCIGGVDIGDHVLAARWLLLRMSEDYALDVSFDPMPIPTVSVAASCSITVSTSQIASKPTMHSGDTSLSNGSGKSAAFESAFRKLNEVEYERTVGEHACAGNFSASAQQRVYDSSESISNSMTVPESDSALVRLSECGSFITDSRPASDSDVYVVASEMMQALFLD